MLGRIKHTKDVISILDCYGYLIIENFISSWCDLHYNDNHCLFEETLMYFQYVHS